jgi:putative hydrolase of the HAD superfamily
MIKACLFALDGTLLDRERSLERFLIGQYHRLRHQWEHVPQDKFMQRFFQLDQRGYVWKDYVYRGLVEEFSLNGVGWEELLADYVNHFREACVPFHGAADILHRLRDKGIRLALVTNGRGWFQTGNIRALGIESYFDAILISEWEGVAKPSPEIFHRALDRLGVEPAEAVFVGDHPVNDIAAARAVGMKAVWKRDPIWPEPVEVDGVIDELGELLPWLEEE